MELRHFLLGFSMEKIFSILTDVFLILVSEETTWTCAVCTFANHEALEVCEMCDMPRNRTLEARA